MAFLAYKDVDGILVNDVTDTVDGVPEQVLHISRDAEIPARYYVQKFFSNLPDAKHGNVQQRMTEKSARFRMVHVDWGNAFGQLDYTKNTLALIQILNKPVNDESVYPIQNLLRSHQCDIVRWDKDHLLVQLPNEEASRALGEAFLDDKLDDVDGHKVERIDPSVLTNPPKVLFEIDTNQTDAVSQSLSEVIAPFAARFTYIVIRQLDGNASANSFASDEIPALIVSLLFHGRCQSNAERTVRHLYKPSWKRISLPSTVTSALDFPIALYQSNQYNVPMIGVQTGCPQSGIQLTVLVQDLSHFGDMETFYCNVTGLVPLRRSAQSSSLRYCTFPLSSRAELVIAFYPDVRTRSLRNASIYIQVSEVGHIENLIRLSEDHWHTNDPEGNRVVLYRPLK